MGLPTLVRNHDFIVVKLNMSDSSRAGAMGLTSNPVTTAAGSDPGTKSFPILPEPRAEFETDSDEC